MASIGKNIKIQRKKQKLSQEELAEKIYTTRQTVSNYENGKSRPDIDTLEILARALNADVMTLLYGEHTASEKETQTKVRRLSIGIAILAIAVFLLVRLLAISGTIGLFLWDQLNSEIVVHTDIAEYNSYIGQTAEKEYRNKFDMDESIFPASISGEMQVEDYKMVYYNPWDAQYLSYLAVRYSPEAYDAEVRRLQAFPTSEYRGVYGAEGFDEKVRLLAMNADPVYGLIYALSDGSEKIIYVEILFCNYFMDLEYKEYIDPDYLPIGFDAAKDNLWRKTMMGS